MPGAGLGTGAREVSKMGVPAVQGLLFATDPSCHHLKVCPQIPRACSLLPPHAAQLGASGKNMVPPQTGCVALAELHNYSGSQLPYLQNRANYL